MRFVEYLLTYFNILEYAPLVVVKIYRAFIENVIIIPPKTIINYTLTPETDIRQMARTLACFIWENVVFSLRQFLCQKRQSTIINKQNTKHIHTLKVNPGKCFNNIKLSLFKKIMNSYSKVICTL